MRPIRCILNYHKWREVPETRVELTPWLTTWYNQICDRCGDTAWFDGPLTWDDVDTLEASGLYDIAAIAKRYLKPRK